ncbi:MAG TPA: hypothetical protein VFA57_13530 [Pseudolabrys sp.]|nr:hypothetical protein [Pseudolabrys sp.]
MIKKLIIAAALAAAIGTPAMAQSWNPSAGSGNIVGSYSRPYSGPKMPGASDAFAYAPAPHHHYVRHWHRY